MVLKKQQYVHIKNRVVSLKLRAAQKYNISPEQCHVGHVALQAMLEDPNFINQHDAATGLSETHGSVAKRASSLASAMNNYGLQSGDTVVIIGPNHLDLCIPYFACHFNGYSMCAIDPVILADDLQMLFTTMSPMMIFCPDTHIAMVENALNTNKLEAPIIPFDEECKSMNRFIAEHKGTDVGYMPAVFDQSKTIAWLMMTSGTTGTPKVALIPYETLLNGICSWWSYFTKRIYVNLAMGTIQWMSSLMFFISGPLMTYSRVQSSVPLNPHSLVMLINKYRPNATAWLPHTLEKFVESVGDVCDLTSFIYIAIGGSAIERPLLEKFRKKCSAELYLVYGMTELLVPIFNYDQQTPFGSTGKPLEKFQYRLVKDEDGFSGDKDDSNIGELWIKGDDFFKGYLNNPEETAKVIREDGWVMTGDIFRKDENDDYYFVERKRLLIKYMGHFVSPFPLEEVIKQHPGVLHACVVAVPEPNVLEYSVGVVVKRENHNVEPEEIFSLMKAHLLPKQQLHGGLVFMDSLPTTASGKIHRSKIREIAMTATNRVFPKNP